MGLWVEADRLIVSCCSVQVSCLGFSSVEKVNLQLGVAVHACYPSTKHRQEILNLR